MQSLGAQTNGFIIQINSVPEPSTLILLGAGLVGVGIFILIKRRFKN